MGIVTSVFRMARVDGQEWCGSRWLSQPADGFACEVATRRTVDVNGHYCDYARCDATKLIPFGGLDRCILLPGHVGEYHVGEYYKYFRTDVGQGAGHPRQHPRRPRYRPKYRRPS